VAKFQELSLFDVIGERKNRYEFSFITTFNAYLPFYEQIALRRLIRAGCRVNTLLMDTGQFAACVSDTSGKPLLAGRNYTIIPVDAGRGVFHPKIILLIGQEYAALCVGSHNLTLSGFGKNRELTTVFEINPKSDPGERQTFRDVWKALRFWTANQPEELLDSFSFVEKEVSWLIQADEEPFAENSYFFYAANENGLSLWEQIKPTLPKQIRRATLVSPFFDEDLKFLRKIKDDLNPKEFIVGIEPKTVQLSPKAHSIFPDVKFVEVSKLRENRGYLHAKAIYLETETGDEILISGSANASGAAWLDSGRSNCEAVIVSRAKEAAAAIKATGLQDLAKSRAIESKDWETIERNKLKRAGLFAEKDKQFLLTAIETEAGFKILLNKTKSEFDSVAELVDATGETIFIGEIAGGSNQNLFIEVAGSQIRFATNVIKLNSTTGETFTAFVHHTAAIVAKFHKGQHREVFTALENFDIPVDDKFWRLFEKIVFVEGDELPDYMEAQVSLRFEPQNLRVKDGDSETLQETFSLKTADIGFKERLYRNSLDSVGELLSFLNRRLYSPNELSQNFDPLPGQPADELLEPEEYETEDIVDPKFELERMASLYYQRTRTIMRRMVKKLSSLSASENRDRISAVRQLAVVLGVLHWIIQLEKSEKFSFSEAELDSIVEEEWKLFVAATSFVSSIESKTGINEEISTNPFSELSSIIVGYLVWLGYDCGCDVLKLDELRNRNYSEESSDGWTDEEILEATACFLKLAVLFCDNEHARQTFEKSIENDAPADWIERNIVWMNKINQVSNDLLSVPLFNRKARNGDLVYLTKLKDKEILVVSDDSSSITIIALNAENRRRKFAADSVAVIDFDTNFNGQ